MSFSVFGATVGKLVELSPLTALHLGLEIWEHRFFQELKDYIIAQGHGKWPSPSDPQHQELAFWVTAQRHSLKPGKQKLANWQLKRQQMLTDIGFVWFPYAAQWEQRFQELVAYTELPGKGRDDCPPPGDPKYGKLATWVSTQRRSIRPGLPDLADWRLERQRTGNN